MPTLGHIFLGFSLIIPIMYFAREKFNYKLAFIFLANQIYGPDIMYLIGFIDPGFHSILGFIIMAIPLSAVFSYCTRFSIEKSDKKFPLRIEDAGIRDVTWLNAFYVTVAGGLLHFFIDQFFHQELTMNLFTTALLPIPEITPTLQQMFDLQGPAYHTMNPFILIGEAIVVGTIIISLYFFKKGYKETIKIFAAATVLSVLLMVFVSTEVYGGEREYAVLINITLYILIPLSLLFYAARNIVDKPNTKPEDPKVERKTALIIVAAIGLLLGIIMLAYGLFAIVMANMVVGLITGLGGQAPTEGQVIGLGIYYAIIALTLVIGSIGIFFKSNICRILAMIGAGYFIIFGFPIAIMFFLAEKDVKALFIKNRNE